MFAWTTTASHGIANMASEPIHLHTRACVGGLPGAMGAAWCHGGCLIKIMARRTKVWGRLRTTHSVGMSSCAWQARTLKDRASCSSDSIAISTSGASGVSLQARRHAGTQARRHAGMHHPTNTGVNVWHACCPMARWWPRCQVCMQHSVMISHAAVCSSIHPFSFRFPAPDFRDDDV